MEKPVTLAEVFSRFPKFYRAICKSTLQYWRDSAPEADDMLAYDPELAQRARKDPEALKKVSDLAGTVELFSVYSDPENGGAEKFVFNYSSLAGGPSAELTSAYDITARKVYEDALDNDEIGNIVYGADLGNSLLGSGRDDRKVTL